MNKKFECKVAMDLSHIPSTKQQLYSKSFDIVGEFKCKLKKKSRFVDFHAKCSPRQYGCRITLIFYSPTYCRCEDDSCQDGKYILQTTIVRVKCDDDIQYLEVFLRSQYEIAACKYCFDTDSSE